MIFVTVGTQLPFERLVRVMDRWAERHQATEVFAQIGDTEYRPKYMEYAVKIPPGEYAQKFEQAALVVAHAGMGTVIRGMETARPLVLMPRLASRGEHRSDHQLSTANRLMRSSLIDIVNTEDELAEAISRRLRNGRLQEKTEAGVETSPELLARLRAFIYAE